MPTSPHRSLPKRAVLRRVAVVVGTLLSAMALGPLAAEPATTAEFEPVRGLSRLPDDARRMFGDSIYDPGHFAPIGTFAHDAAPFVGVVGTLVPVLERGEIWQIFPHFGPNGIRTAVAVRDAATLKITSGFTFDGMFKRGGASAFGGEWMVARDGQRRIFFLDDTNAVVEVDLQSHKIRRHPTNSNSPIGGFGYDPHGNDILLASAVLSSATVLNAYTLLFRLDLDTGELSRPRPIRSCNAPLPSTETNQTYQIAPYVANERFLYMPCQRAGNSGAVVRIERNLVTDPASAEEIVVGPTNLETVLLDARGGRFFMPTQRGELWAFDIEKMAFVGVVGANPDFDSSADLGYGIDPETGRVFFQSPSYGLGLVEGRFFPIPQAKTDDRFAAPGQELIISNAATNEVFVAPGFGTGRAMEYTVYRVRQAPVPPAQNDPDRNTIDAPEVAGVTEGRYNGSAGAYGARALLANGFATIVPAPAIGELAPTADVLANNLNAKCGFFDRELLAGRVSKAEADTGSTAAEAIAVDIDSRTKLDLDKPSRCEPYGKNGGIDYFEALFSTAPEPLDNQGSDPRWNRDPATCSTSLGDAKKSAHGDDHGSIPLGTSEVQCPSPGNGDLVASARSSLTGPISVGDAFGKTVIARVSGGLRTKSEAVANDIRIGEGIQISEIRSTAESFSNGRPAKGDMSSHKISIKGLRIAGANVCGVCDVNAAVDALNRALAGRAQFRTGASAADGRLIKGSPRGALTAVQKSPERQVSDQSLVGDFTSEIPALELVVFNDNSKWGRARQLYQFAGVATTATYNIVGVPKGLGDGPGPLDDIVESVPGLDDLGVGNGTGESPSGLREIAAASEGDGGFLGGIKRALRALARGVRLFFTSPRHALLLLTGWGLFTIPVVLYRRRLTLATLD